MLGKYLKKRIWPKSRRYVVRMDVHQLAERLENLAAAATSEFDEAVKLEIDSITDKAAEDLHRGLLSNLRDILAEQRKFRHGFESRLRRGWQRALDIFDLVQALCLQFGAGFNDRRRPDAAARQDVVFEALTRLHGRACLTASEIGALLRTGHATGAMARWRTLHELAVAMMFIAQHGQEVARRYLEHQFVEMYHAAGRYQEYCERLGEEPLSKEEIDDLRIRHDELIAKYGRQYAKDYGWAADALSPRKATFAAIAESIDMRHWSPYLRMASDGVHAGPRGGFFDIGLHPAMDAIPASPSHFGLADPGAHALVSLMQATIALLNHGVSFERDEHIDIPEGLVLISQMKTLEVLVDEGATAFSEAHRLSDEVSPSLSQPPRIWSSPTFAE